MSIVSNGNDLKVLVVVHARGGSKRIPFKNILPLCGKPLIGYCLEASLASRYVDKVIVSTDHPEIKKVSESFGAEVPFVRPADISEDVASELVTIHALDFMEARDGVEYSVVVTVQPTTPMVLPEDFEACIGMLAATPEADTVMSGVEMRELPTWARRVREDGFSENIFGKQSIGDQGISQKQPKFYIANGGIYASRRATLKERGMIIGPRTMLHIMPWERSIDIDEPIDFFIAEKVMEMRQTGKDMKAYILSKSVKLQR